MNRFKFEKIVDYKTNIYGYELLYGKYIYDKYQEVHLSKDVIDALLVEQLKLLTSMQFWEYTYLDSKNGSINIFLNIEPYQLYDEELIDKILSYSCILSRFKVSLCLEITERVEETKLNEVLCKNIKRLSRSGVKIALDDYSLNEATWRTSFLVFFTSYINFVKVNVDSFNEHEDIIPIIKFCESNGVHFIFEKIENENDLEKALNFLLFKPFLQGYIFK